MWNKNNSSFSLLTGQEHYKAWKKIFYLIMLRAILNNSWRQHPTKHQLYGHLPPIMKTIQVRRTRHAEHCWRSRDELIIYGPPHMAEQKQDNQLEHTYSSYVRIRDVALKTCLRRWTIGKSGEKGPGISVLAAWHDDDDDDVRWFYIEWDDPWICNVSIMTSVPDDISATI